MSKKVQAVTNAAPIQSDDVMMPEDIATFCSMIITGVADGKVSKTGLITSKEKLEKLKKLEGVTVVEGDFEAVKIRGHETIAIVNTDRVVTIRKTNENKESNNPNNNKENGKMENETKANEVETKVETTNAAPTAEAAPATEVKPELPAPTPQALADAKAMGEALVNARRQIDAEHPYWREILKGAGIGAATAVGVIGVCAIYNWITGK